MKLAPNNIALIVAAVMLSAAAHPVIAQTECTDIAGLKQVPTMRSLSDLSISIAKEQDRNLRLMDVTLLEGACARSAYGFRMSKIIFDDATVVIAHPEIEHAQFVMASNVEQPNVTRSLNVGLWKTADGYLIAAYILQEGAFSTPVELLRSKHRIKSVTYFPSPDSPSGKLGLLVDAAGDIALASLNWDHAVLSRTLFASKKQD